MNAKLDCMLTTTDNPYNPFTHFEDWYKYDMIKGYNTCGYLANMTQTSSKFSDSLNDQITYDAMNKIIELEPLLYKKIFKQK